MLVNICDVLVTQKKKKKNQLSSLNINFTLSVIAILYAESVKYDCV
jgi:hypothetical protein